MQGSQRISQPQPIRQMWRAPGKREHFCRHHRHAGAVGGGETIQHSEARSHGDLRVPIRTPCLGCLRQSHQQRCLGRGETTGFLAKPGKGSGTHPFDAPAIGSVMQIKRQYLRFAEPPLKSEGQAHLSQLARPPPRAGVLQKSRHLHRQGRAAGNYLARNCRLTRRAQSRQHIHAVVTPETLVFVVDQH